MDAMSFIQLILTCGLVILGYLFWKDRANNAINQKELEQKLIVEINQTLMLGTEKIVEKLSNNQHQQIELISQMNLQLESRLGHFQLEINQNLQQELLKIQQSIIKLTGQSESQQNSFNREVEVQFSRIQLANSQNLNELQTNLQSRLQEGIQSLIQVNNQNFELLVKQNQDKLNQINQDVQKRLDESFDKHSRSFVEVSQNLSHLQATAQRMIDSTKSVDKLNSIFDRTNFKAYGDFGEKYLENLLQNHLSSQSWRKQAQPPGSFDRIDFLITIGDKTIGIDAKFPAGTYQEYLNSPLELKSSKKSSFLKSVIEMAKDISQKYYKPGFIDILLLYVPSEGMYSEIVSDPSTMETLANVRVTLSSPTTIFPLVSMISGYEQKLYINEHAEQIMTGLKQIKANVGIFQKEFKKLGEKLQQAKSNYEIADRNLLKVQDTVNLLEYNDGSDSNPLQGL